MAIKVSGTEVISDTKQLEAITAAVGKYDILQPASSTTTANISFSTPMMSCVMSQNTTFTESNQIQGKTATLLLDTTTNSYTPTFSSNINWVNNTEPTWSGYQHWQITFTVFSSSDIRAGAVGYTSTATTPTETISLQGSSSSPLKFFDMAGTGDLVMGWRFGSDGNVYKYESPANVGGAGLYLHDTTTWNNITPSQTYWIQVANHSGNNLSVFDSDTLNAWIALTSNRDFRYRDSRPYASYGSETGAFKVEIAERNFGTEQHGTSPNYYSATVGYLDGEGFPETTHRAYWNGTLVYNGGAGSTTSEGDIFLGTDGNYYRTGTLQQQTGNPTTYSYAIQQATFNILATGYYGCSWEGGA